MGLTPWVLVSFFDTRTPGPEWFNTSSNYVAPTCTQIDTTSGTCWYPYEGEIDAVNIGNDMDTAGPGPLANVFRLAQARSRSMENFWSQVLASQNHLVGNIYVAFDSNMAHPGGCTGPAEAGNGCGDVYVVSGAGGVPLY